MVIRLIVINLLNLTEGCCGAGCPVAFRPVVFFAGTTIVESFFATKGVTFAVAVVESHFLVGAAVAPLSCTLTAFVVVPLQDHH